MIIGTGIDIIAVARVRALIESGGSRFLGRWFSEGEIEYSAAKAKPWLHFAARLAAKEAAIKALRLERAMPRDWRDIAVTIAESGAPSLALGGSPRGMAERLGVETLHLSLSHCDEYAVASVVAEGLERAVSINS
jgi:holo-[acyl-carrier protein] synthase